MQTDIKELQSTILAQAKYFLEESGEFYPFASVITNDNRIKPIGAYFEEEYPSSSEVLTLLEEVVFEGLKKKDYLLAAVGLDVSINVGNEQQPALQIRIYDQQTTEASSTTFFLYGKKEESYFFREIGAG